MTNDAKKAEDGQGMSPQGSTLQPSKRMARTTVATISQPLFGGDQALIRTDSTEGDHHLLFMQDRLLDRIAEIDEAAAADFKLFCKLYRSRLLCGTSRGVSRV